MRKIAMVVAAERGDGYLKGVRTLLRAVAIALTLALSSAAHGAIFGWTDSEGTLHFTNNESGIPPRYRDKAKLLYHEPADSQTSIQSGQTQTSPPPSSARAVESPTVTAQPVANPEQQNARKVPGVKKSVGRHLKSRASTEEE